jgi:hypothetical protein
MTFVCTLQGQKEREFTYHPLFSFTMCLIIEGKIKGRIEVTRRRGRRRKQLLDDLGDRRGYSHLKEEALDRIQWRNRFGRGCGPVVCLTDY